MSEYIHRSSQDLARMEHLLLCDLRHLLTKPHSSETQEHLASVLDCLFELLPARFTLMEQGGYLRDVTRKFPSWRDQVEALRIDHALLYEDLRELRRNASDPQSFGATAPRVMERVADWMERLEHHEAEERRLSQLATNLEIGVGD